MAARNKAWHPDKVRQRIQTSQLINRLASHALGQCDMSQTQVSAALGLLKKTLPDLTATELSGEIRQRDVSNEPITDEQWESQYSRSLDS